MSQTEFLQYVQCLPFEMMQESKLHGSLTNGSAQVCELLHRSGIDLTCPERCPQAVQVLLNMYVHIAVALLLACRCGYLPSALCVCGGKDNTCIPSLHKTSNHVPIAPQASWLLIQGLVGVYYRI